MSYRQTTYQIMFGTKDRERVINENHEEELYRYIGGIVRNKGCKLFRINGTEDHLHILSDLHPSVALSDFVKDIKIASSMWLKASGKFPKFKGWQEGYGAFSYSARDREWLIDYVAKQKEHHKHETFFEEFKRLLVENEVEYDPKYLV